MASGISGSHFEMRLITGALESIEPALHRPMPKNIGAHASGDLRPHEHSGCLRRRDRSLLQSRQVQQRRRNARRHRRFRPEMALCSPQVAILQPALRAPGGQTPHTMRRRPLRLRLRRALADIPPEHTPTRSPGPIAQVHATLQQSLHPPIPAFQRRRASSPSLRRNVRAPERCQGGSCAVPAYQPSGDSLEEYQARPDHPGKAASPRKSVDPRR